MGKEQLRKDKTCLNCRHVVESRYCPNCGQENTDTRKTFHHLFIHFFEDLTHYENAFWKTIRNLLFKPSSLTKEYLSGKRLSYLAPVRLYIFISFITFFLLAILPDTEKKESNEHKPNKNVNLITDSIAPTQLQMDQLVESGVISKKKADSINSKIRKKNRKFNFGYKTVAEMDSIQKHGSKEEKLSDWEYDLNKKLIAIQEKNSRAELLDKFKESFMHNFPKVLFIYMPLFAFSLWLFHDKKRWYYFDHGIFTLHYFSFILLIVLVLTLIEKFIYLFGTNFITIPFNGFIQLVGYGWTYYYFFPAHHRFYGETRIISFLKTITLFFINAILISIILLAFIIYTFLHIH